MDYAQKRLLVLKSSKAIMRQGSEGSSYEDEDNHQPAILALQNSSQWGSVSRSVLVKTLFFCSVLPSSE